MQCRNEKRARLTVKRKRKKKEKNRITDLFFSQGKKAEAISF
jgi:hypothetical protein